MGTERLAVIGAGTMGSGIAQVAATSGYPVVLIDLLESQTALASRRIRDSLERETSKGRITDRQRSDSLERIVCLNDLRAAAKADLVVEAVSENQETKARVFEQLDRICGPETILASNTSSISITQLAASTNRPDLVIGMHFFNPVPIMKLVEVVRGIRTGDATVSEVADLARRLGKTPVEVRDYPGFVANRLVAPMINEAAYALMEGVADAASIDAVMKLGMNHPMGPLELADLIGLDVCLDIIRVLHSGFGDDKYRPCPLLVKMVAAGRLGRKSGRGFYVYPSP